uniref:Uncharacterized protein n=1 Tax=Arundo donax TaxID=35708 RepID=A0A0A9C718_ARUDO
MPAAPPDTPSTPLPLSRPVVPEPLFGQKVHLPPPATGVTGEPSPPILPVAVRPPSPQLAPSPVPRSPPPLKTGRSSPGIGTFTSGGGVWPWGAQYI